MSALTRRGREMCEDVRELSFGSGFARPDGTKGRRHPHDVSRHALSARPARQRRGVR
ncbi:hypothetical protein [Streptomyces coeruleorubidus]|uniref:hypothetical protein n=1 Tax=Streptomyces coeruleorubidus TaxID=116188 RepID=UPI0036483953